MTEIWGVHGVPMALQQDGWWLDDGPAPPQARPRAKRPLIALILLVGLADILFWGHTPGLSLALYAAAIFAAALTRPPRPPALIVLTLAALPVIDHVQPLSLMFLALGLIAALTLTRIPPGTALWPACLTLARLIPLHGLIAASRAVRTWRLPTPRIWALPVGGTLVLLALLIEANPILDGWLSSVPLDPLHWLQRALFWSGVALLLWPLLTVTPQAAALTTPRLPNLGLNATSVSHALIAFNAVLGLQTLLDARYLWSGAALPPGLTLAEYAHRGAYPLLATALLAGAFALAARPWAAERRALKPLLILWLAQNILLTLSALYRLDLYVQSFGLTYLRVHALIWMALVAAGLALTLAQIALSRSNPWLLIRCTALGLATLYAAAFINFADLIARTNVAMGKIDPLYLCSLGPTAAASVPEIAHWVTEGDDFSSRDCLLSPPSPQDWRNWGFRNWLVLRNLARQEAQK